ncbi:Fe-S cluster assembly protein HesB [Nocardioides bruguierae]|uniref:Fe-S cluster assembly protein HesB n=1 Tax=Nocardioides bruguierae TaxID=2945102 RepID=A0A9X2D590_9ACTN|nr:Fe-S cluster assembly protein HesB [Nocardioides bruguierae]MCL8025941.1 Fe-S cluster assembly protein HesB [Nocardioides bruguierae]MCM0619067.1 Fe-S cluster assembly protein HesB [Nocardioides bruguierae]
MLTLTENATTILNQLSASPELPDSAGLRITSENEADPSFSATMATAAEPGDQVVEQGGTTVYLDERAAQVLDDKILDASVDQQGQVEFALGVQG